MELEVRHLRLVQTVATLGSLTAAAGELNLTQSALSHQLRDIEDRLGTPLFLRRSRRMIATAAGQQLIATAQRVLVELARTEARVRDIATERQGLLRVGHRVLHLLSLAARSAAPVPADGDRCGYPD